jgi:hypothetical protein
MAFRDWFTNNPFFQTTGQFSKTAFICMSTWVAVMFKYIFSGATLGYSTTQTVIAGKVIPAVSAQWLIAFDYTGSVSLLTLVFGLYFGGKFTPQSNQDSSKTTTSSEVITTTSLPTNK